MSSSETGVLPEPDGCPFCGAPSHAALLAEVEVGEPSEAVMNAYWDAEGGTLGGVRAAIAEYLKERARAALEQSK